MNFEPEKIKISPMPKTWILDLDGTLVVHDGPYILGRDENFSNQYHVVI